MGRKCAAGRGGNLTRPPPALNRRLCRPTACDTMQTISNNPRRSRTIAIQHIGIRGGCDEVSWLGKEALRLDCDRTHETPMVARQGELTIRLHMPAASLTRNGSGAGFKAIIAPASRREKHRLTRRLTVPVGGVAPNACIGLFTLREKLSVRG